MNSKKIPYILIAVSLVMIFSGCVSSFIISLQKDQKNVRARVNVVNDSFEEFSTNTSLFEDARDQLYTSTLSNLYYESLVNDDVAIKNKLSNYEAMVDEISKQVKKLDGLCDDVYYPDSSVNNKCVNYKSIYEQVINYFVRDIELYNKNVNEFNKTKGSNVVNLYKTNKKYIDYNNDKKYDGKED